MANNYKQFLTTCACGAFTSKAYARAHGGKCKACFSGVARVKALDDEGHDRTSPDMYSHMGGMCRGDDWGLSPDY